MRYTDLPENVFDSSYKCLVVGQSILVKESAIKDFLFKTCNDLKIAYCVSGDSDFYERMLKLIPEVDVNIIAYRTDIKIVNSFSFSDWVFLIEHFADKTTGESVKNYIDFLLELMELIPKNELFLDFYLHFNTVRSTMEFLNELVINNVISEECFSNYKNKYLKSMNGAIGLEGILNFIKTISFNHIISKRQRVLFWCLARKVINTLDNELPIIIKFDGGDIEVIKELLVEQNNKKILYISEDMFRGAPDKTNLISYFDVAIFSRLSYLPSAKLVENLLGVIKKPKVSYSESYDRRIGNNGWFDKLFNANKTVTYTTSYEYEPLFSKEEISSLDDDLAIFITQFERGYMRCVR